MEAGREVQIHAAILRFRGKFGQIFRDQLVKCAWMVTAPTRHDCKAERIELSSITSQLAICKAYSARAAEAAPSTAYDAEAEPLKPGSDSRTISFANEVEERRRLLDIYPEAVIVHQSDGKIRV